MLQPTLRVGGVLLPAMMMEGAPSPFTARLIGLEMMMTTVELGRWMQSIKMTMPPLGLHMATVGTGTLVVVMDT